MRKQLFILSLLSLLSLQIVHAQDGLRPRGDANCDWAVNISDVNTIIEAIINDTPYHAFYTYAYDVNGDQAINIADLNAVVGALLGDKLSPMPSYSGTLPVLFINTEGHRDIVSKEEYLQAEWWLDAMGHEEFESIGSPQEPQEMLIKGHGNYTWTDCDKKSFRLKFDEKHKVLGMNSSRHWVIKANALNRKGKIEDALPFEIGRRMGMAWNPRIEPVEVVLNGEYIGFYLLYEKIRVDKHRVNIIEQSDYESEPARITGGWLLEINNYKEPDNITFTEGNGKPFWVMPHSPDSLSQQQRSYITEFLMKADSAIYVTDKEDRAWEQYIDIDSLAVYYLVQETVDNLEAFSGSCYMYKERGEDTKLVFGPLWDCDHSFYRYSMNPEFDKFIYQDVPNNWYSRWIGEIVKFPHFQERVRHHWKRFYREVYLTMDEYMDQFVDKIEAAGNADYVRWPQYSGNNTTYRLNRYGKPSFHKKVAWLNSQWGEGREPSDPSNDSQEK